MELARRAVIALAGAVAACGDADRHAFPIPGDAGPTMVVEVLNATDVSGLARGATRRLRRAGFDVVYFGNAPPSLGTLDTTRIVVRRGVARAGDEVRRALGSGTIVVEIDSTRLLDVSVLLGRDFASSLDFYP